MTEVIKKAYETNRWFIAWSEVDEKRLKTEIKNWTELNMFALTRKWQHDRHTVFEMTDANLILFTDASQFALGVELYDAINPEDCTNDKMILNRHYQICTESVNEAIHIKEAKVILLALQSAKLYCRNQHISIMVDNMAVVKSFEGLGSHDIKLSRIIQDIIQS